MGVWVDTDMGFDDLVAILVLQHAGLQIDGVSLVFGNASLERVKANAAGLAAALGWHFPIHAGRDRSVLGRMDTAADILGITGLPSAGRALPEAAAELPHDAFAALCRWLEGPGPHRLLALGPLGNIAALALARPDLAARIDEFVWMGGGVTTGNHTASAEFNAAMDPEAVAIVLAHGLPLKMVDLDACRRNVFVPADVGPLRAAGGPNAELLADLFAADVDIGVRRGRPGHSLYDPVAAMALAHPELIQFRPARIDMELAGSLTRGRTVIDTRPGSQPNASYAAELDAPAVRDVITGAIRAAAARSRP
ncbi:MAG TPA: nucleoside hydrolase [Devosia sp.]|nr:nucleoside hydrolase [Devosia sp.]